MAYEIFPGNESEKLSMRPLFKKVKAFFGIQRTIMVADRGLNTFDNIDFIAGKNDRNPGEKTDNIPRNMRKSKEKTGTKL